MKLCCLIYHFVISICTVYAFQAIKTQKDGEISAVVEEKLICYSQTCENKDVGNGIYRWKCSSENEGKEELCDGDAFCFEGQQGDEILRMCVKKADYISKFNSNEYEKMVEAEDPCTTDKLPKLIPLFYPYGQECYCFTALCNKKLELPEIFDVKGVKRATDTNITTN